MKNELNGNTVNSIQDTVRFVFMASVMSLMVFHAMPVAGQADCHQDIEIVTNVPPMGVVGSFGCLKTNISGQDTCLTLATDSCKNITGYDPAPDTEVYKCVLSWERTNCKCDVDQVSVQQISYSGTVVCILTSGTCIGSCVNFVASPSQPWTWNEENAIHNPACE